MIGFGGVVLLLRKRERKWERRLATLPWVAATLGPRPRDLETSTAAATVLGILGVLVILVTGLPASAAGAAILLGARQTAGHRRHGIAAFGYLALG